MLILSNIVVFLLFSIQNILLAKVLKALALVLYESEDISSYYDLKF